MATPFNYFRFASNEGFEFEPQNENQANLWKMTEPLTQVEPKITLKQNNGTTTKPVLNSVVPKTAMAPLLPEQEVSSLNPFGEGDSHLLYDFLGTGLKKAGKQLENTLLQAKPYHRTQEDETPTLFNALTGTALSSRIPEKQDEFERQATGLYLKDSDPAHKSTWKAYLEQTSQSPKHNYYENQAKLTQDYVPTEAGRVVQHLADRLGSGAIKTGGALINTLGDSANGLPKTNPLLMGAPLLPEPFAFLKPEDSQQINNTLAHVLQKKAEKIDSGMHEVYKNQKYFTMDPKNEAFLHPVTVVGDLLHYLPDAALAYSLSSGLANRAGTVAEQGAIAAGFSREAAIEASKKAVEGIRAFTGTLIGGTQATSSKHNEAFSKTIRMEEAKIRQHPHYQELVDKGIPPEQAQLETAYKVAKQEKSDASIVFIATSLASKLLLRATQTGKEGMFLEGVQDGSADTITKGTLEAMRNKEKESIKPQQ